MSKKGAIAAAVVGVGALGLGAVALMRSGDTTQKKDADTMFSGLIGGGATGGYSDTTGVITTPNNTPSSNIGSTISGILSDIIQTPPQTQTPIIITPSSSGTDDLIPLINAVDNPSDEVSDIKQGIEGIRHGESAIIPVSGTAYDAFYSALVNADQGFADNGGVYIPSQIGASAKTSTAVEYSPFDFAPTPKQADYSSYNAGKTGGSTANTPTTDNSPSKEETKFASNKVYDRGTTTQQSEPQNKVEYVTQKAVDLYSDIASTVTGFFGGLFGGK